MEFRVIIFKPEIYICQLIKIKPEFISVLDSLDANFSRKNSKGKNNSISVYLGKNQKEVLRRFQVKTSLFLSDLKKMTSLEIMVLDKSLKGLFKRGFLSRKKEIKPNSLNHCRYYRYSLTELGRKIKIE